MRTCPALFGVQNGSSVFGVLVPEFGDTRLSDVRQISLSSSVHRHQTSALPTLVFELL